MTNDLRRKHGRKTEATLQVVRKERWGRGLGKCFETRRGVGR